MMLVLLGRSSIIQNLLTLGQNSKKNDLRNIQNLLTFGQNCQKVDESHLVTGNLVSSATSTALEIERMSFCVSKVRFVRLSLDSLGCCRTLN